MNTEDERLTRLLASIDETPIPDDGFTRRVLSALPAAPRRHPWRRSLLLLSSLLLGSLIAVLLGGSELFEDFSRLVLTTTQHPVFHVAVFLAGLLVAGLYASDTLRKCLR